MSLIDPSPLSGPPADPWHHLRSLTSARIAIGRAGGSQPTRALLDFRLSHARAKDAVNASFDVARLCGDLAAHGITPLLLASGARDRREFLLRPDLGRRLAPSSLEILRQDPPPPPDLVIIISDGLSALAANSHAVATAVPLLENLTARGWNADRVVIVPFGRVKLQDEIGHALGARFSLMLLGERPGLGAPDSLGAYFTAHPSPEKSDADRNCISNIRPEGLPPAAAAAKLAWLLDESRRTGLAGVSLKDGSDSVPNLLLPHSATCSLTAG
ncbi:MAG: ethanolamine ammonia-lyase subunit EutC [Akkermansiaceae bacterium]